MTRDVSAYLLAQQANATPELAQEWADFEDLYNKRLWHQLTLKVQEFVKRPHLQEGGALIQLYENFLSDFENKINALSLVEIVAVVLTQYTDPEQCLQFLVSLKEKVKGQTQAEILCNILSGRIKLVKGDMDGVKKMIADTETLVDSLDGVTSIHGRFFQLCSDYHQFKGNHAQYYRDALRYLGCSDLAVIPDDEKVSRAFTLCLAALLGEGVYNFGELLAHPILESLGGQEQEWVVQFLHAFNSGSLDDFEKLRPKWTSQPDLSNHEDALRQKIMLLCLMEMTFKRPGNKRVLSFAEIAEETRLPQNEVELLIMKALSLGLVRGSIDEVDRKVTMSWVQPRVLNKSQIANMKQRLNQWCKDVQSMEHLLEDKAQDILT